MCVVPLVGGVVVDVGPVDLGVVGVAVVVIAGVVIVMVVVDVGCHGYWGDCVCDCCWQFIFVGVAILVAARICSPGTQQ